MLIIFSTSFLEKAPYHQSYQTKLDIAQNVQQETSNGQQSLKRTWKSTNGMSKHQNIPIMELAKKSFGIVACVKLSIHRLETFRNTYVSKRKVADLWMQVSNLSATQKNLLLKRYTKKQKSGLFQSCMVWPLKRNGVCQVCYKNRN